MDAFTLRDIAREDADLLNQQDPRLVEQVFGQTVRSLADVKSQPSSDKEQERLKAISAKHKVPIKVVSTIEHIAREAAFGCLKAKQLGKQLASAGLNEELLRLFMEAWAREWPEVNDRLVDSSFSVAPHRLTDVNWKLKLISGYSRESATKEPLIQLDLTRDKSGESNVSLELSHSQASDFYTQLEKIQEQIDLIQKQ